MLYAIFNRRNKKQIASLAQEFEMRKNANQYARQLISKSGELDTRRLHRYPFTNDLFKRVTSVKEGKSHGMIFFLDMSGSMQNTFRSVVEQLLILCSFCQKIDVPFDVYGFTDNKNHRIMHGNKFIATDSTIGIEDSEFYLKHLLSSRLNDRRFNDVFRALLVAGDAANFWGRLPEVSTFLDGEETPRGGHFISNGADQFRLCATPFNEALVASISIIENFKQVNHCDIINVIYLTDGEGTTIPAYSKKALSVIRQGNVKETGVTRMGLVHKKTGHSVVAYDNDIQTAMTILAKTVTGCRHIGFYVGDHHSLSLLLKEAEQQDQRSINGGLPVRELDVFHEERLANNRRLLSNNRYVAVPNMGYDNYYYLIVDGHDDIDGEGEMDFDHTASKSKMLDEFASVQKNKRRNRILTQQFAQEIAEG
jgi:hypothetical protein